jgi:LPXTG-site transpeptidase (sortase) family protein
MAPRRSREPGRTLRAGLVLAVGAALVTFGAWTWLVRAPEGVANQTGDGQPSLSGSRGATPEAGATAEPAPAPWVPGAPRWVSIPRLGVHAPVIPVRAPGGTLVPPSDPDELGWWQPGAEPGAETGSALIAGHTVHTGGGALDHLERLRRGSHVSVRTDQGLIHYVVQRVATYRKGALADRAEELFSQEVPGRLVLVTCEDWDGERYLSNVVVTATPSP